MILLHNNQSHFFIDTETAMFSAFKRSVPQVTILCVKYLISNKYPFVTPYYSHRSSSPPSVAALQLLQSALSSPYPPSSKSNHPLKFDLEVVESVPPTSDQLATILSYQNSKGPSSELSTFLSAHPSSDSQLANNARSLVELARKNPNVFKWPIVVDWTGGRASIGDVEGVKDILESIRKERDGESEGEDVHQPKGWFS